MNILQIYQDYNVSHETEGHKHCRPGWVNTSCPFCTGNPGLHLGYNLSEDYFYCWRCGWHPTARILSKLIGIDEKEAKGIVRRYGGHSHVRQPQVRIRRKAHTLPNGITPLGRNHKQYLLRRGFDPDKLSREWNLVGTGPVAKLDKVDYKHRIIAPVYWDGEQVSFQGRDITNKHPLKYITCPKDRELIFHKHILYGRQEKWQPDIGICVEGITDVWRFGPLAFATFGIKYTRQQVRVMVENFRRIAVIFDPDPQAQKQAIKLVAELNFRGIETLIIPVDKDPGSMAQEEANLLTASLLP